MVIDYTVVAVCGDYALLRSDAGNEKEVAMFMLPVDLCDGDRLRFEDFTYKKI